MQRPEKDIVLIDQARRLITAANIHPVQTAIAKYINELELATQAGNWSEQRIATIEQYERELWQLVNKLQREQLTKK